MQHFSKRLATGQGSFTFYFNRQEAVEGSCYHVSVIGSERKVVVFYMEENAKRWQILDLKTCPSWILHLETTLESVILRHTEQKE